MRPLFVTGLSHCLVVSPAQVYRLIAPLFILFLTQEDYRHVPLLD
ncbi:MAG: hypothetical protein VKL20_05210 [Synechocystis sp.]|nr:hypothetical protein [Synechocystis sp.]